MSSLPFPTLPFLMLDPQRPFIHRDLSWIQFNERVLAEARSKSNPLLEKLKFLAISASNLDEFFMIRFASLQRSISSTRIGENKDNLLRIHGTLLDSVSRFGHKQHRTFALLRKEAAKQKIFFQIKAAKSSRAFALGREIFEQEILPQLVMKTNFESTALQDLRNLQLLAYVHQQLYFEVPNTIPLLHWREVDGEGIYLFFLDDLILSHLDPMLPGKEKMGILRITRDSDYSADFSEEDPASLPDVIKKKLGSRDKGKIVRVQHHGSFSADFLQSLAVQLKVDPRQVFRVSGTLFFQGLFALPKALPESIRAPLSYSVLPNLVPQPFRRDLGKDLFSEMRDSDLVLHHPYDSFDAFLEWVRLACEDPNVVSIEQTIYRTDSTSGIVELLKKAASTKKVKVILELRARFDETNNLKVAEELRQAGAEVHFGFGSLKLHAKIILVTRREDGAEKRYTHLSTGNYNARTARQYTDISILTCNQQIGEDVRHFFDAVFQNKVPTQFQQLVTAPAALHQKIRSLIRKETEAAKSGKKARVIAKVNALIDEKIIEDLYAASNAGVEIDMIVRGSCSLIPGIKGLSENIRVTSIVDRFLEHSRMYYFQNSEVIYLSSADWMPRNFFSRLEIAFPVLDKYIYRYITEVVLPSYLRDNVKARRLSSRGVWEKVSKSAESHQAQEYFAQLATARYASTPLSEHPYFLPASVLQKK